MSAFQILNLMTLSLASGYLFNCLCDHYHHFKEDIALMAEMRFTTYRFSICWSRVLPEGTGKINPKGIEFYNQLIDGLKYNIIPFVTMLRFAMPESYSKTLVIKSNIG